jgi:hypothetical protein
VIIAVNVVEIFLHVDFLTDSLFPLVDFLRQLVHLARPVGDSSYLSPCCFLFALVFLFVLPVLRGLLGLLSFRSMIPVSLVSYSRCTTGSAGGATAAVFYS